MEKLFPDAKVEAYAGRGFRKVDGWLVALDARLIRTIGCAQDQFRVTGSLGEIGVHHGKLFILLYLMLSCGEKAFAVDVFDQQHLNVDGSGHGNLTTFRKNIENIAGTMEFVEIFRSSSTDLKWDNIEERIEQKVRLLSIDGGHTADITYNDIDLANRALIDQGVLIIDDYFNPDWPGVSEGAMRFFLRNSGALAPVAIGENKIFYSRPAFAARYGDYLIRHTHSRDLRKIAKFLDREVPVFRDPRRLYDRIKQSKLVRTHRNHHLAEKFKPVVRRLFDV